MPRQHPIPAGTQPPEIEASRVAVVDRGPAVMGLRVHVEGAIEVAEEGRRDPLARPGVDPGLEWRPLRRQGHAVRVRRAREAATGAAGLEMHIEQAADADPPAPPGSSTGELA